MTEPRALRDLAVDTARQVSDYLLEGVGAHSVADTKSSLTDLVTEFDRGAEERIVSAISRARPDDGFVGEEGTDRAGTSGVRWIIDPIDGTANFVLSHPGFGVSIAAEVDDVVVAGAVADPVHRQVFDAALGHGARCNGETIRARPTTDIGLAVVATGFSFTSTGRTEQARVLAAVLPRIADIRRMGSAALDLCGVAIGRVDAYYEVGLNRWDLAAGALIAVEAGAAVYVPDPDARDQPVVAAAPGIAEALVGLLTEAGLRVPG